MPKIPICEEHGKNWKLYYGDCLTVLQSIPWCSIDIILTDPPYGMGFQSNWSKQGPRHKRIIADESIDARFLAFVPRLLRSDGGAFLMFCNWETSDRWRDEIEHRGLRVKSQIIWDRVHHGMGDLLGAFAPCHDIIWYCTKGRRVFQGKRPKSVLRHKRPSPSQDFGHPTCKPTPLLEELLAALQRDKGGYVLDPFMGSGSTGVAARTIGLPFIGIELDTEYFRTALTRIREVCSEE